MKLGEIITSKDRYNLLTGNVPILFNRFLTQQFRANKIDLTREQWSVLAALWKEDGCSQQTLADNTFRDKPGTTRLIDTLEKEGYLSRKSHPTDRRQNLIYLTEKGKKEEKKIMEVVNRSIEQATKGLTEKEIIDIKKFFQQIQENIQTEML